MVNYIITIIMTMIIIIVMIMIVMIMIIMIIRRCLQRPAVAQAESVADGKETCVLHNTTLNMATYHNISNDNNNNNNNNHDNAITDSNDNHYGYHNHTMLNDMSQAEGVAANPIRKVVGRGYDTVGNPPRAQISQFELFELLLLSKLRQTALYRAIRASSISINSILPPLRWSPCCRTWRRRSPL